MRGGPGGCDVVAPEAAIIGEMDIPSAWASEPFCYLTTTGRRSGRPHTIEIWFALESGVFYLMAGGRERADWVRNLRAEPNVILRVAGTEMEAIARVVDDDREDALARRLLAGKYQGWEEGAEMSGWAQTALPVAVTPRS